MTTTTLPAVVADLVLTPVHGFDREQWTTTGLKWLDAGDVVRLPGSDRNVVVTKAVFEPDLVQQHGWVVGSATDPESRDVIAFRLPGNTSVLFRCDVYYSPAA